MSHIFKKLEGDLCRAICDMSVGDPGDKILAGKSVAMNNYTVVSCLKCQDIYFGIHDVVDPVEYVIGETLQEQAEQRKAAEKQAEQRKAAEKAQRETRRETQEFWREEAERKKKAEQAKREEAERRAATMQFHSYARVGKAIVGEGWGIQTESTLQEHITRLSDEGKTLCLLAAVASGQAKQEYELSSISRSLQSIARSQAKMAKAMQRLLELVDRREKEMAER